MGGGRPGKETVQAYIQFNSVADATEPSLVLRNFRQTRVLQPGEAEQLYLSFSERDLSVYSMEQGWLMADSVQVHLGSSSIDLRRSLYLLPESAPASTSAPPSWNMFGSFLSGAARLIHLQ